MTVSAVIFDLDGVLLDSEGEWDAARRQVAFEHGGRWTETATRAMMGMSSTEWSAYMHEELGVALSAQEISNAVVARLKELYTAQLPLLPGAHEAVGRLAEAWPLGLASSANRPIIDLVLVLSGLADHFAATVSAEEVARGKPAPDVYLEAARRVGRAAAACVAIEDSSNGIRSAAQAGMTVIAAPNREFPPAGDALSLAAGTIVSLDELTPAHVRAVASGAA